jgi:hypothetical protein
LRRGIRARSGLNHALILPPTDGAKVESGGY